MAFKKNKDGEVYTQRYRKPTKNRLTQTQLYELDRELEKYRVAVPAIPERGLLETTTIDQTAWMIAQCAKNEYGAVVITGYSPTEYDNQGRCTKQSDSDPILFQQLLCDWDQWLDWKGKQQYGEKKRIESYKK